MAKADIGVKRKLETHSGALAISIGLHLLFALGIFATALGTMPKGVSDPFGEGEAIDVSMAGWEGAMGGASGTPTPTTSSQVEPLDRLVRKIRVERSELVTAEVEPARRQGNLAGLFEEIGRIRAPGRTGDGSQLSGREKRPGEDLETAQSSRSGTPTLDAGSAGLWGQVEPCWRRLPRRSRVPVLLEVKLNADGRLAAPPRIVRPGNGRPDEQRLLAEAQAMAALQACLPYRAGLAGVYRLGFNGAS